MIFENVLIPLQLNESSARVAALTDAIELFGTTHAHIVYVSADTGAEISATRQDRLSELSQAVAKSGVRVTTEVSSGSPAVAIPRIARERGADYIAFSWKAKSWVQRTLVGSVTQDVVRLSDVPVFVHKRPIIHSTESHQGPILYATDFHETDTLAIPLLNDAALGPGEVVLLHSGERAPDPVAEGHRSQKVEAELARLASGCPNRSVTTRSVLGSPRRVITAQARRLGARLVVVGKSDNTSRIGSMLGSTAEAVVNQTSMSVLILSPDTRVAT
ncbi:MAG: universal stress protein [Spirochaetaceae bacterium]|nr:MAG: universal stress protein [Spirochaetaceae bacterium]